MRVTRFIAILAMTVAAMSVTVSADAAKKKGGKDKKTETVADSTKKETAYQKIFKDKKVVTSKGFMTLHMLDNKDIYAELPKDIMGRDLLLSVGVDQSSNGGDGPVGFTAPKTVHAQFSMSDSLIILKEVNSYRYLSMEDESDDAIQKSRNGIVLAKFQIKAMSPDSTAYVFDATGFFSSHDKRMNPVDPMGADSFGGMLRTKLTHKSNLSMPAGVEGFTDNVSVLRYETYSVEKDFAGWSLVYENERLLTLLLRKSIMLLPEKTAGLRYADTRIGVNAISKVAFHSDDRGSRANWYVNRWNIAPGEKITFYIDTLFTDKMAASISAGVLKWNDAFQQMGMGEVMEVKPYPSSDPEFNVNDLKFSCIRYEAIPSDIIRSNTWTDPRSGEILCASITVPCNALQKIHFLIMTEIAAADPDLRTSGHEAQSIYDALQAKITNHVGTCLGLGPNYVGSNAFPADSLASPAFTSRHGLSSSIMDQLPANFFTKEGDKEKGACLVQTELGAYDKYAINWLYCSVPGAMSPEDEVPYLDSLIVASKNDPLCYYVRRTPYRSDPRFYMDPRPVLDDLSSDPMKALEVRKETLRYVLNHLTEWIGMEDPDHTFRSNLNESVVIGSAYPALDMMKYIGGIYVNEKKEGDQISSYEFVPREKQREILLYLIEYASDMSWLDETDAWRDDIFVRSFSDYVEGMIIPEFDSIFRKLAFAENKMEVPYTVVEAFGDMLDCIMADVRDGKPSAKDNILFQIFMINASMNRSNANIPPSRSIQLKMDEKKAEVFSPMAAVDFQDFVVNDYRIYEKLVDLKDLYRKAASREKDKELKMQYEYFAMAIERALKID